MRGCLKLVLSSALLACGIAIFAAPIASGSNLPNGFRDTVVFEGLEEPTSVRFSSDGRVFVAEKAGRILVYDNLQDTTPTVFADFRTDVFDREDRGLLGLVLDPDFPSRPYVYALYTYDHILGDPSNPPKWGEPDHTGDDCLHLEGACEVSGRLVRLTADGGGDEAVDDGSGHPLQDVLVEDWCQQFSSHSIGDLEFGTDGALYASGGDGASFNATDWGQHGTPPNPCADPPSNIVGGSQTLPGGEGGALRAQDLRTPADPTGLDGTVIRVDPETGQGLPGNPMFGSLDPNVRRIVAYGFRNPFRFAIDPAHDEIYVGNVGWVNVEEVDRFPAIPSSVYNSGWPCYEGLIPNDAYQGAGLTLCERLYEDPGAVTQPFFHYQHVASIIPGDECPNEDGWAVSGLDFYDGTSFPSAYHGALFFADAVRGCIYVMTPGPDGRPDPLTTSTFMSDAGAYSGVNVETGPDGNLYYVRFFGDPEQGSIHKISYDPGAPTARLTADPEFGAVPLQVHLDAGGSTDPDSEALSYEWDLDGNGTFEALGNAERTQNFSNGTQNRTISVRVKDGTGKTGVAKITVYPGDTPPEPQIDTPDEALTWGVGDEIQFAGLAEDGEDGDLPEASLYWKTRLYHCPAACHAHPLQVFPGVSEGSLIAPEHEYPSHIEFVLTATDSRGLSATRTVSVDARGVDLQIESDPPGIELGAGLATHAAPFTLPVIEGSSVVLAAPATAHLGGREYQWSGWSDGGARVHTLTADEAVTYTATYAESDATEGSPQLDQGSAAIVLPIAVWPRIALAGRPAKLTHRRTAKFTFSSSAPGASFSCRLDGGAVRSCRSPRTYKHLRPGRHVFRVVATDPAAGTRSAPVVVRWRVVSGAR